jgi:hypothetical protein
MTINFPEGEYLKGLIVVRKAWIMDNSHQLL